MSMPSYGTISAPKISSDDFATLSFTPANKVEESVAKKVKEPKSESEQSSSPLDSFLPSMSKKGPEEAAADKAAAKKAAATKAAVKEAAKKAAAVPKVKAPTYDF
jgi:hypothetical protein